MASAKDLFIRLIPSKVGRPFIKKHHYSGKTVNNSNIHFGVFLGGRLEGVLAFGPPLDKRKLLGTIKDSSWSSIIELNRMAFTDRLPRNSESRSIAFCVRALSKNYPKLKAIISFSDGCQCGDGTIYRASGFMLTGIKENKNLCRLPGGEVVHKMSFAGGGENAPRPELAGRSFFDVTGGSYNFAKYVKAAKAEVLTGYQLRYIKTVNGGELACDTLPFSEIDRLGARMYKGESLPSKH